MVEYRSVAADPDYQVGADGSVWSKKSGEWQRLRGRVDKHGYPTVKIQGRRVTIHYLVLEAFVGPRPPGLKGLHGNDIKTDNRLENLRWGTHRDNAEDALRNGRVSRLLGEEKAREIVRLRAAGVRECDIAAQLETTQTTVQKVLRGKLWADVTGIRPRRKDVFEGPKVAAGVAWLKTWEFSPAEIASFLEIPLRRVERILSGKSYSRVTGPGGLDLLS